ncbi:MAG: hypothetical protein ACKVU4_04230 [Phycisphaerales bacterium]
MTNLRFHDDREGDAPATLLFPGVKRAVRAGATRDRLPTADSIRMVEDAMRDAQTKFDRLRQMLGYTGGDDRPRAA